MPHLWALAHSESDIRNYSGARKAIEIRIASLFMTIFTEKDGGQGGSATDWAFINYKQTLLITSAVFKFLSG